VERSWLGTVLRVKVELGENLGSLDCFTRFEGEIEVLFSLKRCATVRRGRKNVVNSISALLSILVIFSLNQDLRNLPSSTLLHRMRRHHPKKVTLPARHSNLQGLDSRPPCFSKS